MKSQKDFELKNYLDSLSVDQIVAWYRKQVRSANVACGLMALFYFIVGYLVAVVF